MLAQTGHQIELNAIERVGEVGLRGCVYISNMGKPAQIQEYAAVRGSYGFLIEVMRLWSGKSRYPRAIYAMQAGLKAIVAEIVEADGAIAADVYANRARVAATTKFDENNLFATKTSKSGNAKLTVPCPSIYVDGSYKDADATASFNVFDTVSGLRALPTAYVLPADAENIEAILKLLDMHAISYTRIRAGSTLPLRRYAGISTAKTASSKVTLGDVAEVTFASGAYVVTMDTADAYLIAFLFEPDSFPYISNEETLISFAHMGHITDSDALYRSEVDDMTLLIADMVDTPIALGDVNADGKVELLDALTALRALLNGEFLANADMNGDKRLTLIDVLRILRLATA